MKSFSLLVASALLLLLPGCSNNRQRPVIYEAPVNYPSQDAEYVVGNSELDDVVVEPAPQSTKTSNQVFDSLEAVKEALGKNTGLIEGEDSIDEDDEDDIDEDDDEDDEDDYENVK